MASLSDGFNSRNPAITKVGIFRNSTKARRIVSHNRRDFSPRWQKNRRGPGSDRDCWPSLPFTKAALGGTRRV